MLINTILLPKIYTNSNDTCNENTFHVSIHLYNTCGSNIAEYSYWVKFKNILANIFFKKDADNWNKNHNIFCTDMTHITKFRFTDKAHKCNQNANNYIWWALIQSIDIGSNSIVLMRTRITMTLVGKQLCYWAHFTFILIACHEIAVTWD